MEALNHQFDELHLVNEKSIMKQLESDGITSSNT